MQTSQGALNDLALGNVTLKLLRRAVCPAAGQKQGPGGLPIHIGSSSFSRDPEAFPPTSAPQLFFQRDPEAFPLTSAPQSFFQRDPEAFPPTSVSQHCGSGAASKLRDEMLGSCSMLPKPRLVM